MPHMLSSRPLLFLFVGTFGLVVGLAGCETEAPPSSYVARVGDHYLTQDELDRLTQGMGHLPDSSQARQQIIEQWITRTLLLREAERMNLKESREVKRQLEERRRSTLVDAMTNRIYDEAELTPSDEEIRTYFERHREQLRLREPYVRVRYLSTTEEASAQTVRSKLQEMNSSAADSTWARLVQQFSEAPDQARSVSTRFLPMGRLLSQVPFESAQVEALQDGEVAPLQETNGQYHVLQLVRRVSEGEDPELRWVRSEIRRRLRIQNRKQMYAREVQRLRNRARADNVLETPDAP